MTSLAVVTEGIERAAALGFTDVVVHWPRAEGIYAGDESVLEGLVDQLPRLQALVDRDVRHFRSSGRSNVRTLRVAGQGLSGPGGLPRRW